MLNNYFNPNAVKPQNGYAPTGPLGGGQWAADQQQQEYALGLQRLLAQDALKKQMMETESYGLDSPVRAAKRPADIAKSGLEAMVANESAAIPGYGRQMGLGAIGEAQTKQAAGDVAMGTRQSTIDHTNAGNQLGTMERAIQQMEYISAAQPLEGAGAYKQLYETLPPHLKQYLSPNYDASTPQRLQALSKALQNNVAQRRTMDQVRTQTGSAETIGRERNASNERIADTRAFAQIEAAYARMGLSKDRVKKLEDMVTQHLLKQAQGIKTSPEEDRAFMAAQQIMMNARAAAGFGIDPQMLRYMMMGMQPPAPQVPAPVAPPNSAPQAGTPQNPIKLD
jgi:hypothetical protein